MTPVQCFFKEENEPRLQDHGQESKANSQVEAGYWGASSNHGKHSPVCFSPGAFPPAMPSTWNILLPDTCQTQPLPRSRSLPNGLEEVFPSQPAEQENLISTVYIFTGFAFFIVFMIPGHLLVPFFFPSGRASHKNITSMSSWDSVGFVCCLPEAPDRVSGLTRPSIRLSDVVQGN